MAKQSLCKKNWQLIYVKNSVFKQDGDFISFENLKQRGYTEISASIPGNAEIDLVAADKMEDPFYADNHGKRENEYLHYFYYTTFECEDVAAKKHLVFEGIDTFADIYLNDEKIGSSDNMLISHEFSVSGKIKPGENILLVHIKPTVIEARKYPISAHEWAQKYNFESLYVRKAPHMFGWDICPRIVSAGIWKPVYIKDVKVDRITEFYCYTSSVDTETSRANLYFMFNTAVSADEITDYKLHVKGVCRDSVFEMTFSLLHTSGSGNFYVDGAKLWWPKLYGEQNLYDITVTLFKGETKLDEHKTRIGIRTAELIRTSTTNMDGDGEFCFKVNGRKIFCMGTNWVPVDALHSRDEGRLPKILPMLNDLNCNMIRMWGGNVYESDTVYRFCDENGILIWQDFVMGCGMYPQDDAFCKKLYDEAVCVVKRLRDHPSVVLWAGDNENDACANDTWSDRVKQNPNDNRLTRNVLSEAVRLHDGTRPYLPSSPYIDSVAALGGDLPEQHLWGPRDYFKGDFYKKAACHFASETGYHGCVSPKSIEKFIPKSNLWTAENNENWAGIDNKMWLSHAASPETDETSPFTYRIRLMADQVTTLFGASVPNTLSDFARASQISQAEAFKYFIERFRIGKWRRTGILWWNLMDCWPQFSDAVVDYYFVKKLAYSYIKRSQTPICLMFDEPNENKLTLHVVNEFDAFSELSYKVTDLTDKKEVCFGKAAAEPSTSFAVDSIPYHAGEQRFYLIEWEINGEKYSNHYMSNIINIDYKSYLEYLAECGYDAFEGF